MLISLFPTRILVLLITSCVFFFLGNSLFSLTHEEAYFALATQEMTAKNSWLVPYAFNAPNFEKPLLSFYFFNVAFEGGGVNPFAGRFFPALFAMLGVMGTYLLGLWGYKDERKAFFSALILSTSVLYVGMGKLMLSDMLFSVFILFSLLCFYSSFVRPDKKAYGFVFFYVFAALATLTKGPLGLIIPEAIVILFLLYCRDFEFLRSRWAAIGFAVFLVIALPWYIFMIKTYGDAFNHEFFYQNHWKRFHEAAYPANDSWYFYLLVILGGIFPWTVFFAASCKDLYHRLKLNISPFDYFLLSWVMIIFVFFQIAHTKHASYILPLFPAIALLIGGFISNQLNVFEREYQMRLLLHTTSALIIALGFFAVALCGFYKVLQPFQSQAYLLSGALIVIAGFVITLTVKERMEGAFFMLGLTLVPILATVLLLKAHIEPYISVKDAVHYLPQGQGSEVVLSSQNLAAGVRFYTGKEILPFKAEGISGTVKAILNQADYESLQKLGEKYEIAVLGKSSYNYVLKITPKPSAP